MICVIRHLIQECNSIITNKQSIEKSRFQASVCNIVIFIILDIYLVLKNRLFWLCIQYWHYSTPGCQFQDPSELLQFVHRSPDDGRFHCTLCNNFSHQNSSCTRNHVESHHYPNIFSYPCDLCEQIFDTRTKFNTHKQLKHKKVKQQIQ